MRLRHRSAAAVGLLVLLTACSGDPGGPQTAANPPSTASSSAAPAEPAGTLETRELADGGEIRHYDVYAPPAADERRPRPAVVVLPGTNVALDSLRETTAFPQLADTEDFLVLYVDAPEGGFDAKLCCGGTDRDVDFVRAVLADVATTWPVDLTRVYATGFSAGAAMSYKLAVRAPDLFAAVAPVSGGFYPDPRVPDPQTVVPAEPPSLIAFAGGTDSDYDDILGGLDLWRLGAGCGPPDDSAVADAEGAMRSVAECADGSTVEVYTIEQMGHSWPGGSGDTGFGDAASGVRASALIWAFFATRSNG